MPYTLHQLSHLEDIRTLKHRYFRCIDTANAEELVELFAEDVVVDYRGGGYRVRLTGRQAMLEFLANSIHADVLSMHHGHMPEIRLTGEDTAEGSWYLQDLFIDSVTRMQTSGTAIYRDKYRLESGLWKIAATEYDRITEFVQPLPADLQITTHYLATRGLKAEQRRDISQYIQWAEADAHSSIA